MTLDQFYEVIDYAIEREVEAAEFYKDLQSSASLQSSKELLRELELMEQGHIKVLKNFNTQKLENFVPPKIPNLKLSETMEILVPNSEMTFQEILIIGMKREEQAYKLYSLLAEETEDEQTKLLFIKLASEESKHKFQLESIYDDEVLKEN